MIHIWRKIIKSPYQLQWRHCAQSCTARNGGSGRWLTWPCQIIL